MRDYLTNLAARILEPKPAIQPRLASLFEPLSVVGPLFPRTGRVADRFEIVATRDEAASDALIRPHAHQDPVTQPPKSSLPITSLKIESESADSTSGEMLAPVSDQQRKPVETMIKLAERGPQIPKEPADDIKSRNQIVVASRPSDEGNPKVVVPVITAIPGESSDQSEPGRPEKFGEAANPDGVVTLVAHANDRSLSRETAPPENKLVEPRGSETLNQSPAANRSSAITPLDQNDLRQSPSHTLVVPRATIAAIRAERTSRSSVSAQPAAHRDATARTSLSNIKPHGDSRVRGADAADDEPIGPETQPSINVTIGRVEIRAQLPSASRPSRKNSESPKLMGLDDYLRQRAQGGKR